MPGKDSSTELVLLALPHNPHTGPLEPEVEAADSGKEAADTQHPALSGRLAAAVRSDTEELQCHSQRVA